MFITCRSEFVHKEFIMQPNWFNLEKAENLCQSNWEEDGDYSDTIAPYTKEVQTIGMVFKIIGNETRIDFTNEQHRKLVYIAHNVDRINLLTQEEAKIAVEMKGGRSLSYQKVAQVAAPIARVVDRGVQLVMTSRVLGPAGNVILLLGKWYTESLLGPPAPVTPGDLLKAHPNGIPLEKAQEYLKFPLPQETQQVLLGEFNKELQGQGAILDQMAKEKPHAELAKKLTDGLTQMAVSYHAIAADNEQYRAERHALQKGFERVCRDFSWNFNLDTFKHHNATQVAEFLHANAADSIAARARQIHQLSDQVAQNVHALQSQIEACGQEAQEYEQQQKRLAGITQNLGSLYNERLKDLEGKATAFKIIQAAASLCEEMPGGKQVTQGAGMVAGHFDNKRRRRLERYNESLDKSKEGMRHLGVMGSQTIAKLSALQESEREEQAHLIAMRRNLDPVVYMDLMTDLSRGCGQQKETLQKELTKVERQLHRLEQERSALERGSPYREKQRDLSLLDAQIAECEGKLRTGQSSVGKLDELLAQNQKERALAEYISPISKLRAEILREQEGTLPDDKSLRWQQELSDLFQLQSDLRQEGFLLRQQVIGGLAPLVNNLEVFGRNFNINFNGAGLVLKMANDCNSLANGIHAIKDFVRLMRTQNGQEQIPWKILIPGLIIPLSTSLASVISLVNTVHALKNPEKDPMIAALERQGEELVKVQKEFYHMQLKALNERYNDLSREIKDGLRKVILKIEEGNAVILNRLELRQENDYKLRITDISNQIRLERSFQQLCIYLQLACESDQNGLFDRKQIPFSMENPALYTGYLFRTQCDGDRMPPNLSLFKALVEKAVQLRKEQAQFSSLETQGLQAFIREARMGIQVLYILAEFPQKGLAAALDSLQALSSLVTRLSSAPESTAPNISTSQESLKKPRLGAKKFTQEYWGDKQCSAAYDKRVAEMYQAHDDRLNHNTKGIILPSSDGNLVPLLFPREYIEKLENKITPIRTKLAYLNAGALTLSSYDLKPAREGKGKELRLQWSITLDEEGEQPRLYLEAVAAAFDEMTVAAFQENSNELLIQAMYGGKQGLGLPGKGSRYTSHGQLFTAERMFPGLFTLFHLRSGSEIGFVYNSERNEGRLLQTASDFQETYTTEPFDACWKEVDFIPDPISFFAAEATAKRKQNSLMEREEYRAYSKSYQALQTLFRLQTGASEEDLKREMERHFALLPLDHADFRQAKPDPLPLAGRVWNFYRVFGGSQNLLQALSQLEGDLRQL